jgi:cytoskeleton protein RodZ
MSDEQDKPVEEPVEAEPKGPRGGERLAEARREQQISVLEIAKELHLDEPKVRALERNDFEMLGAPVFAKGHLKKYASLVGVDEDDVLTDYYQMTRQEPLPPVIVGRKRMRQEVSPGPWIAAIVVIHVAVASYWWFAVYSSQAAAPATSPEVAPVEQQGAVRTEPVEMESEPRAQQPDADPEPVASEPEPQVAEPVADDGQVRLSLEFTGECWTEVSDATGRRLFFEMGREGQSIDLTGAAPFAVLFGNVDNVRVQVNGNDFPVSSSSPGSRMARLTIMQP